MQREKQQREEPKVVSLRHTQAWVQPMSNQGLGTAGCDENHCASSISLSCWGSLLSRPSPPLHLLFFPFYAIEDALFTCINTGKEANFITAHPAVSRFSFINRDGRACSKTGESDRARCWAVHVRPPTGIGQGAGFEQKPGPDSSQVWWLWRA